MLVITLCWLLFVDHLSTLTIFSIYRCQGVDRWSAIVNGKAERAHKDTEMTFAWLPKCMRKKTLYSTICEI